MIAAVREAAYKAGRPSIALAVTLQFELRLRQKDVIGERERPGGDAGKLVQGPISDGTSIWS